MKTIDLYEKIYKETPKFIDQTINNLSSYSLDKIASKIKKSKRIFFTASGSSIPSAMLGANYLQMILGLPATLVPTSYILDSNSLGKGDIVVFVSQGWNRADATLISQKLEKTDALLVGITANEKGEYAQKADEKILFYPVEEELFCRPTSVITSYLVVASLALKLHGKKLDTSKSLEAFTTGKSKGESDNFVEADYYVVLSSGMGMPGAYNIGLALREGGGRLAITYDIETYGHGWYVPDQIYRSKKGKFHYIVLTHSKDVHTLKAAKRIIPMIQSTKSSCSVWETEYDSLYGNIQALSRIAPWIIHFNHKDKYDMNTPPGMEENRGYHDKIDYFK